jgi:hypothetical protein
MGKKAKNMLGILLCLAMLAQTTGCGYVLYPERRGQTGGRIDAGVAVMDGICLFLFIVPGIVAFAVDFSTGAIYLSHTKSSLDQPGAPLAAFDPKHFTNADIERIIKRETGHNIRLDQADMRVIRLGSLAEMGKYFAALGVGEIASVAR